MYTRDILCAKTETFNLLQILSHIAQVSVEVSPSTINRLPLPSLQDMQGVAHGLCMKGISSTISSPESYFEALPPTSYGRWRLRGRLLSPVVGSEFKWTRYYLTCDILNNWRANREASLPSRILARFFCIGTRALFPDIRCLRITFDPPCFML